MAAAGKFQLTQDYAFDIPNSGGKSAVVKKGSVVQGIVLSKNSNPNQVDGGEPYALSTIVDTAAGKVNIQIPIDIVERYEPKQGYNWIYLAAAAGLVFWYVTRNKKERQRVMPTGYAGIGGVKDKKRGFALMEKIQKLDTQNGKFVQELADAGARIEDVIDVDKARDAFLKKSVLSVAVFHPEENYP